MCGFLMVNKLHTFEAILLPSKRFIWYIQYLESFEFNGHIIHRITILLFDKNIYIKLTKQSLEFKENEKNTTNKQTK